MTQRTGHRLSRRKSRKNTYIGIYSFQLIDHQIGLRSTHCEEISPVSVQPVDKTPRLGASLLAAAHAQKHVTVNEALLQLDRLVHLCVLTDQLGSPPSAARDGDIHLVSPVAASAGGAWSDRASAIAVRENGTWLFCRHVRDGCCWVQERRCLIVCDGAAWADLRADFGNDRLGINATADANNRLTVAASGTLLNYVGASHRLAINKATATDTASVVFQTAFSGLAEIGLAGGTALSVRVSPNGANWKTTLKVDPAGGHVSLPLTPQRETLGGPRAFFVSPDGSNVASGRAGNATFRSVQKALNVVFGSLDLSGHDVTIYLAPGSYAEALDVNSPQVGAGRIILAGQGPGISAVTLDGGAGIAVRVTGAGTRLYLRGLRVTTSGFASLFVESGGFVQAVGPIEFGRSGVHHVFCSGCSIANLNTPITLTGGAAGSHLFALNNGLLNIEAANYVLMVSPVFGASFANTTSGGIILATGNSFAGAASGARFFATVNGVVQTFSAGPDYFPGSTPTAACSG